MPSNNEQPKKQTLFQKVLSFLAYKPPTNSGFILEELPNESDQRVSPEERENLDYGGSQGNLENTNDNEKGPKRPIRAKEWRRVKDIGKKQQQPWKKEKQQPKQEDQQRPKKQTQDEISVDIDVSLEILKREFSIPGNADVVIREFKINKQIKAFVIYIDGMADRNTINDFILRQLMDAELFKDYQGENVIRYINDNVLPVSQAKKLLNYQDAITQVLMGVTVLFVDGYTCCLAIESRGFEKRGIDKPSTESVVRGSQEAFTEALKTNTTQIRRIIKNKNLVNEFMSVGRENNCLVSIMYIRGIANPDIVKEIKRRIKSIKTDFIGGDGMLEQLIEDDPFGLTPQVLTTERPDRTASHLLEGKVAVIVEGTPFAMVMPITFLSLMHSPEDSFLRWQYGSALRMVRIIGLLVALLTPGMYIALVNYHQQMIPTDLVFSIAKSREAVPFPTVIEVLLMEFSFELIREAGLRMPSLIGNTLGIIGALILGQAAVGAGIVSPILIIVVALTGLGSFTIPNYSLAFAARIIRFVFIFLGSILGFFGIAAGLVAAFSISSGRRNFGVPFFTPGWPKAKSSSDLIIRYPIWKQENRPDHINPINKRRQPKISRGWIQTEPPEGQKE
ncbi:spore germination protein [Bacillota bacterium LX-D]|nr:spore germination protein [Bacillota bacterium LX-D]